MTATALAAAALQPGCGQKTTLNVRVVTPPGSGDPFAGAATARMTVSGQPPVTAAVSGGKFTVSLDINQPPTDQYMSVLIEALDAMGNKVGSGQTPNFAPQNSDVSVFVNRPGTVGATDLTLPDDMVTAGSARGRKDLMGASLIGRQASPVVEPGLGALVMGGMADDGSLVGEAVIYKTLDHAIIDAGPTTTAATPIPARYGGVMVASADGDVGQQAILWGGATAGMPAPLPTPAEKFDPAVATLGMVWASPDPMYADPMTPGAYKPSVGQVGPMFLICGGSSMTGMAAGDNPLAQAVVVKRNAAPQSSTDTTARLGVTRVAPAMDGSGPMAAARYLHTVTASSDGGSGFIFGGLSAMDQMNSKPVAELYSVTMNTFSPFMFTGMGMPPASRRGHVAARLSGSTSLLVAGGYTESMGTKTVLSTGLVIDLAGHTANEIPLLKTARYGATLTTTAGEFLICGGFDTNDKPLGDCEIFSATTAMSSRAPIQLPTPRGGHLALTLENGLTLLIGGMGPTGTLASIDIYTSLPTPSS
jgi:hypothetical protein